MFMNKLSNKLPRQFVSVMHVRTTWIVEVNECYNSLSPLIAAEHKKFKHSNHYNCVSIRLPPVACLDSNR